jgi:TolB protein
LTTQGSRPKNVKVQGLDNPENEPALAMILPKMTLTPTATPTPFPTATPTVPPMPVVEVQAWPTPDPLAKGGSVAFTMRQNGNGDIYAISIGREQPIRLTNHPADDRDPAWSPDGRQLAFASNRDGNWEIYLLDIESGQLSRLTMNQAYDGAPSWSPDGQWLVYESYREGNLDLYIMPADGSSEPIRLTENPALDFSPSWSPDGRHIAFISLRTGNKDIFIMALDSAFDEFAVNVTETLNRSEDHPAWEPAGRALAYFDDADGLELVYTMPLEDQHPAGPAITVGQGRHPSWSPDGSSLVYAHNSEQQSYVIASSIDAWNVAPQVFAAVGDLDGLTWTGLILPQDLEERLNQDEGEQNLLFVERSAPPRENEPAFLLREVTVDAPAPYLSDQVDDSFLALRQRVVEEAGWDFLAQVDNMFAFLDSRPFPGENDRSWNKAARAFDFYYRYPISIEPQVEIVREDRGTQTYWRVYLRTANQDGSQGEPLKQLPWEFSARYDSDPQYYDQGGKWKETIPTGYYLDFTQLAADYGWARVPAADNWRTFFQGIRYWHFENRQDLSWQEAILELYTEDELRQAYESR